MFKLSLRNRHEQWVAEQLHEQGYEVLHQGWPDFLAVHKKTGQVVAVEVKRPEEKLRPEQMRVASLLKARGLEYQVRRPHLPGDPPRKIKAWCPDCGKYRKVLITDDRELYHAACGACDCPIDLPWCCLPRPESLEAVGGRDYKIKDVGGWKLNVLTPRDKAKLVIGLLESLGLAGGLDADDYRLSVDVRTEQRLATAYDRFIRSRMDA